MTEDVQDIIHPLSVVLDKLVSKFDRESSTEQALNEPYPNEHSARLRDPGEFKKFRRQNDKFGDGIHAIWGQRKTDNKWELQAIRFSADRWTADAAKQWLKDHGYKPIRFEPATGGKESMGQEQKYECECLKCGHVIQTDEHCRDVACPECGGEMRRRDRPGPGQSTNNDEKAVPVHRSSKAPYDHPWDVTAAMKRVVDAQGEKAWLGSCAWVDPSIDGITAGKLGHHDIVDGKLCVVWNGVKAAGNSLSGARGGVIIPKTDLPGVKRHLEVHYEQFGKEAPWNKESTSYLHQFTQRLATAEMLAAYIFEKEGQPTSNMLIEVFQPDKENFFYEEVMNDQDEPQGLLRIKAMVQRADEPNKNRRIYPYDILRRETETLNKRAEGRKSVSLLDHPVSMFVSIGEGERLWDACGRLCRTWMDGKECWGEFLVEVQDNAKGRHLYSLLKTGFIPGVSSRGTGNTRPEDKDKTTFDVICDDYRLHGYDFVCNESVDGAEIKTFTKESTQTQEKENDEMDKVQIKEAVEEVIKPVLNQLSEREKSEKERHEAAVAEKDKEIETLKAVVAEKDKEIETLKPPETLKDEALKELVAADEPYREEVIELLSVMEVTKESLSEKTKKVRALVTKLLTSTKKGKEHGEKVERTIDPATDTTRVSENEAAFRRRGKANSEE
jgi:predicted RNA-binding Zn-ribbon protein involved in translation (DUF1610 family)